MTDQSQKNVLNNKTVDSVKVITQCYLCQKPASADQVLCSNCAKVITDALAKLRKENRVS